MISLRKLRKGNMWEFIGQVVIVVIGAVVTVRLSLYGFYTQKWWEKKAEAYQEIIEALHTLACCCDKYRVHFLITNDSEVNQEEFVKLNLEEEKALTIITKYREQFDFIISKEAYRILFDKTVFPNMELGFRDRQKMFEKKCNFYFYFQKASETKRCLSKITHIAKKDLKVVSLMGRILNKIKTLGTLIQRVYNCVSSKIFSKVNPSEV